jgi:hypothetical protein
LGGLPRPLLCDGPADSLEGCLILFIDLLEPRDWAEAGGSVESGPACIAIKKQDIDIKIKPGFLKFLQRQTTLKNKVELRFWISLYFTK